MTVDPETRLKELGLELPDPPRPVGAYVPAVIAADLLYLSGTTCYKDGRPLFVGRVGAELTLEQGYSAARQTMLNLLAVVRAELGSLRRVERVVRVTGYVNSAPEFDQQPSVINGASDLLEALFAERGRHARTSVGVSALPGHIPVEIEMVVKIYPRTRRRATPRPRKKT